MVYIEKVLTNQKAFENRVNEISKNLGINSDWLMVVMFAESKLNHLAKSPNSSAVGLIQFTETARRLIGATTEQILNTTNVGQLTYVERYFNAMGAKGKMKSLYDVYFYVFAPVAVGKPDTAVIYRSPSGAYTGNKALDTDKNSAITVGEIKAFVNRYKPANMETSNGSNLWVLFVALIVLTFLFRNQILKLLNI